MLEVTPYVGESAGRSYMNYWGALLYAFAGRLRSTDSDTKLKGEGRREQIQKNSNYNIIYSYNKWKTILKCAKINAITINVRWNGQKANYVFMIEQFNTNWLAEKIKSHFFLGSHM